MNGAGRVKLEADVRKEGLSFLALVVLWRFPPAQCCQSPLPIYAGTGQHERLLAMEHATTRLVDAKGVTTKPMAGAFCMESSTGYGEVVKTLKSWLMRDVSVLSEKSANNIVRMSGILAK